jgi:hypothetical protein
VWSADERRVGSTMSTRPRGSDARRPRWLRRGLDAKRRTREISTGGISFASDSERVECKAGPKRASRRAF